MDVVGNMTMNNTQVSSEEAKSNLGINLHTTNEYKGFSVEIEQEYYNSRAELFVLCTIKEKKSSNNNLTTKRTVEQTKWNKLLSFHLSSVINGEPFQMDYTYKDVEHNDNYSLSLDGKPYQISCNMVYDDTFLQKINTSSYYVPDMNVLGSLGYSQLSTLALAPVAPSEVTIRLEYTSVDNQPLSSFIFSSQFMARTTAQPLSISFVEIKNNQLGISIKDPYDIFLNDYNVDKNLKMVLEKESENIGIPLDFVELLQNHKDSVLRAESYTEEGPLLFRKTIGMYMAMPSLSHEVNVYTEENVNKEVNNYKTEITDVRQGNNVVSLEAKSSYSLNNFHPFHFLDGQRSDFSKIDYIKRLSYILMKYPINNNINNIHK